MATNRDQIQLNGLIVRVGLPASVQVQPDPKLAQEIALEKEEDGSLSLIGNSSNWHQLKLARSSSI